MRDAMVLFALAAVDIGESLVLAARGHQLVAAAVFVAGVVTLPLGVVKNEVRKMRERR